MRTSTQRLDQLQQAAVLLRGRLELLTILRKFQAATRNQCQMVDTYGNWDAAPIEVKEAVLAEYETVKSAANAFCPAYTVTNKQARSGFSTVPPLCPRWWYDLGIKIEEHVKY